jgi:all-trans-retinol 13,14-reductase
MQGSFSILRKIFDYASGSKLEWAPMGELYDRAFFGEDSYDFVADPVEQTRLLCERFPGEEKAIRSYFELVRQASRSSAWYFGEKTMPRWLSRTAGRLLRRKFEKFAARTTDEVLRGLTSDERLIAVLCAQCGDYGLSPKKSSFGIHAIVVDHYSQGGSYPRGGASRIHETILDMVRAHGGALVLKAEVEKVLTENGRATGVLMSGGLKFHARAVVSGAGARNTATRLLGSELPLRAEMERALVGVPASTAHVCLYVGLRGSDAELGLPKNNLWLYDGYAAESLTYISFPSAKDPDWAARKPGKATIQVMAPCDYAQVKEWEGRPWLKRGEKYLAFKKKISDELIETLCKHLPQVRGRIEHFELSTPLSTRHFTAHASGEIYGLEHTPARFALEFLRPETSLPGLFLTGQDIVTVGVGGALYSGVLAATKVLNKSMIARILLARKPAPLALRGPQAP